MPLDFSAGDIGSEGVSQPMVNCDQHHEAQAAGVVFSERVAMRRPCLNRADAAFHDVAPPVVVDRRPAVALARNHRFAPLLNEDAPACAQSRQ